MSLATAFFIWSIVGGTITALLVFIVGAVEQEEKREAELEKERERKREEFERREWKEREECLEV